MITDPGLNSLGLSYASTSRRVAKYLLPAMIKLGVEDIEGIVERHLAEVSDRSRNVTTDVYVAWARKKCISQ